MYHRVLPITINMFLLKDVCNSAHMVTFSILYSHCVWLRPIVHLLSPMLTIILANAQVRVWRGVGDMWHQALQQVETVAIHVHLHSYLTLSQANARWDARLTFSQTQTTTHARQHVAMTDSRTPLIRSVKFSAHLPITCLQIFIIDPV